MSAARCLALYEIQTFKAMLTALHAYICPLIVEASCDDPPYPYPGSLWLWDHDMGRRRLKEAHVHPQRRTALSLSWRPHQTQHGAAQPYDDNDCACLPTDGFPIAQGCLCPCSTLDQNGRGD